MMSVAPPVPVAVAAQQVPAGGLVFAAEAGARGQRSLFTVESARGAMTGASIRIVEGARVPSVARPAGRHVGTLTLGGLPRPLTLKVPARHGPSGTLTLLRRGTLRVTFAPKARNVLSIAGLPAKTTRLQVVLDGGPGQLLTSQDCVDEQNFAVTVTRARGKPALRGVAGVTC
jgi:hypothetical protein